MHTSFMSPYLKKDHFRDVFPNVREDNIKTAHYLRTGHGRTFTFLLAIKCNSPKKSMSSVLGYTLTGDLPGAITFSQNGNN
jgi:hypothetical protein